ncbi:MAG TPA: PspA/IM30 family protein [Nitrospirales bacterium]|nr:PspA/IM30 family protein [Nitrospirales bacterium]HIA13764.1 PspA/IM30 family protein [Nitrospirales bacterium]HIB55297.1 PspA/IM30 family protein [Nitrospirales bacterium]HIC04111.1 PspA/IM30 family protein [Nitrospirales bacterium]HIN33680.1 PspA/IM30 family protein [Nitrospirales bacterium]
MGVFQRMFKIGQSQAHAALDNLEDPIRMTEQGIRDLKKDLQDSMKSLAEVKSIAIRMKKEAEENKGRAVEYERKAMLLLQKMQKGELSQEEADRLALEVLKRKEEASANAVRQMKEWEAQDKLAAQLQSKIGKLKSTVTGYENDLVTLRARARTAASTKKINAQLAKVDSSGTLVMLEKMKNKVEEDESLAQAYGDMAEADKSVDDEINAALVGSTHPSSDSLASMKAKLGIT